MGWPALGHGRDERPTAPDPSRHAVRSCIRENDPLWGRSAHCGESWRRVELGWRPVGSPGPEFSPDPPGLSSPRQAGNHGCDRWNGREWCGTAYFSLAKRAVGSARGIGATSEISGRRRFRPPSKPPGGLRRREPRGHEPSLGYVGARWRDVVFPRLTRHGGSEPAPGNRSPGNVTDRPIPVSFFYHDETHPARRRYG